MKPSPAFTIEIRSFRAWRVAVLGLAWLALVALTGWVISAWGHLPVLVVSTVLAFGVVIAAATLMRSIAPMRLRWDGQDWMLTLIGPQPGGVARAGRLAVMLDLGAWLLLRWDPNEGGLRRRHVWIPLDRRGLEAQWHGLRCALYCARSSHDGSADSTR